MSILANSVAVAPLSSVFVIYLDKIATFLLLEVLLKILLPDLSLNIRTSLRGWLGAIDLVLRAPISSVGANTSSV